MCEVPQRLLDIYIPLRIELREGIKKLKIDSLVFNKQFEEKGPMVKGLSPIEAAERYKKYYNQTYNCIKIQKHYF